ncbi:CAT RNA binding domain-containing protein [Streptococcus pluranimalium]|uniref:CAT RNA binding domain-containing protein n=1 Tax=Streptococcus pluranimalium TaxID=82348 RepID=UPI003F68E5C6
MGEVTIIEKVYNNNVIQVKDESGQELIVMGRDLGFQKKVGDMIDQTKIEKVLPYKVSRLLLTSMNSYQIRNLISSSI